MFSSNLAFDFAQDDNLVKRNFKIMSDLGKV